MPQENDIRPGQRAKEVELALSAGTLGALLDRYLEARFYHLLLIYPDASSLQRRLWEIAEEERAVSFFYFCKLISLLDEGTMVSLSNQAAQDVAQRMINKFLTSIPQGENEGAVDTFEIAMQFREYQLTQEKSKVHFGTSTSKVGDFVRRVDHSRYVSPDESPEKPQQLLVKEFAAYDKWLKIAPPEMILGAEALKAFYKLVSRDLCDAGEQKNQIRRRGGTADTAKLELVSMELTTLAIEEVLSESSLPRPIGLFLRKAPLRKVPDLTRIGLTPQDEAEDQRKVAPISQSQIGTQINFQGVSPASSNIFDLLRRHSAPNPLGQIGTPLIQQEDKSMDS